MNDYLTPEEEALLKRVVREAEDERAVAAPAKDAKDLLTRLLPSKREKDKKRSLVPLAVIFIAIGLFLVLFFNMAVQSLEDQLMPLTYLQEMNVGIQDSPEFGAIFGTGQGGAYGLVNSLRENRLIISALIFSAFALLSALTFIIHVARRDK